MKTDTAEILRAMQLILTVGQVTELRALEATTTSYSKPRTIFGYFNDTAKLAVAVGTIATAKGIYFTPNPVNPALLARAQNRLKDAGKSETTSDKDITGRHWLLVDCDAIRPAGISASDEEHKAALDRALNVRADLAERGWPEPIYADSGNGAHLLYRVDLPADDAGLIERCLDALADQHGDAGVAVDRSVHNPARIWKLYGTVACKGDNTADRPHRMARIIEAPASMMTVTREQLEELAAQAPVKDAAPTPIRRVNGHAQGDSFAWLDAFLSLNAGKLPPMIGPEPYEGGRRWEFEFCPWNPAEHRNRCAFLIQNADGRIGAGCRHDSCHKAGHNWQSLRAMIEPQAPPTHRAASSSIEPARGADVQGEAQHRAEGDGVVSWAEPRPLPDDLPPVLPFDYALLPAPFVPWIRDIADRMQCPPDYSAVAAMVALGALIGRKVGIRPKRRDDWMELANLWGMAIGRPGLMKTPAMAEPLKTTGRLECDAAREHAHAMREFEATKLIAVEKKKVGAKAVREALEGGSDASAIARKAVCEEGAEPIRKRYMTNDSTVEKLGVILAQNPNGILIFRDEMSAFLRTMDREGHEADRGFYLEAWSGKGRFTYDRIGRGTLDIESAIVSILGSIQPGPLQEYLRGAIAGGTGDDGFMQRFQLAVWPDVSATWRNVDQWPQANIRDIAFDVFKRLAALTPDEVQAERDKFEADAIPFLRFDDAAQEMFDEWRAKLEKSLRSGKDHPAIEAHMSKYRKLVPALALMIHLAEGSVGSVSASPLAQSISWARYLESHARRIYAGVTKAAHLSARALAGRIVSGEVADGFALRDVYRNGWSMLANREDALAAADVLASLDWLHERTMPTGGRDRTRYHINPTVRKNSEPLEGGTDKTDKSPP